MGGDRSPFRCHVCDLDFDEREELNRHVTKSMKHLELVEKQRKERRSAKSERISSEQKPSLVASSSESSSDQRRGQPSDDDDDDDDDDDSPNYADLIGGENNYLRPTGPSSKPRADDTKPRIDQRTSAQSSSSTLAQNRELNYCPEAVTVEPIMRNSDVKPALPSLASSIRSTYDAPTSDNRSTYDAPTSDNRASTDSNGPSSAAFASDVKPNVSHPEPRDVKPFTCPNLIDEDDDDDIVIEGVKDARVTGDSGKAFVVKQERVDPDDARGDARAGESESCIAEDPVHDDDEEVDVCPVCNIRLMNEAHWLRHKESAYHKGLEEEAERKEAEKEYLSGKRWKYTEEDGEDDHNWSDPVLQDHRNKVNGHTFQCSTCDIYCTSVDSFNAHMAGAKHKRKEKENDDRKKREKLIAERVIQPNPVDETDELERELIEHNEPHVGMYLILEFKFRKDVRFNCQLCGDATLTRDNLSQHIRSNRHRRKYLEVYSPSSLDGVDREDTKELRDAAKRISRSLKVASSGLNRAEGVVCEEFKEFVQKRKVELGDDKEDIDYSKPQPSMSVAQAIPREETRDDRSRGRDDRSQTRDRDRDRDRNRDRRRSQSRERSERRDRRSPSSSRRRRSSSRDSSDSSSGPSRKRGRTSNPPKSKCNGRY